jgi:hypothetical protein
MRKFLSSYISASLLLMFLATFLWSCDNGGGGSGSSLDNTAPTVSSTSPDNTATNVSIGTTISVTFSEEMDASTVNDTTFTGADGGPVTGTVSYSGTTATFTLTDPLEPSTTYTATVSTGVTDKAGNALAQEYTWSFTTGAAPTGITSEMLTGKAFAQINEQGDNYDNWVIQFDTETFDYWEAQFTTPPDTFVPTVGQGNWSISNGELNVDFPVNATVTLQGETDEYIDVQIDGENARLYKTNPFVEADVSGKTFDYGGGYTETYLADHSGTGTLEGEGEVATFNWMVENGVLVITYLGGDDFASNGYRLVNSDPNIVFVDIITSTGDLDDVFPTTFTVVGP